MASQVALGPSQEHACNLIEADLVSAATQKGAKWGEPFQEVSFPTLSWQGNAS
jgi:hypothetical protein